MLEVGISKSKMEAVIDTVVGSTTSTITNVLVSNLPAIFVIFAGLVALGLILRMVGRLIGGRA